MWERELPLPYGPQGLNWRSSGLSVSKCLKPLSSPGPHLFLLFICLFVLKGESQFVAVDILELCRSG